MMQHQIEFLNPTFNTGLNMTVRNGTKWLKASPGDYLYIGNKRLGQVITVQHEHGYDLPESWHQYNHDPNCRNLEGLVQVMNEAYGVGKWGPQLTIIFFWV